MPVSDVPKHNGEVIEENIETNTQTDQVQKVIPFIDIKPEILNTEE